MDVCVQTIWNHTNDDFPIIMYSEIDAERFETKRLDIFPDGQLTLSRTQQVGAHTQVILMQ